jgi:hypothetical protein
MNACAMIPVEKNEFGNMKIVKKTTDWFSVIEVGFSLTEQGIKFCAKVVIAIVSYLGMKRL